MAGVGDLLGGGDVVRQILVWQVLGQIAGPLLAPVGQNVANAVWPRDPAVPMSPAAAADAVVRGALSRDDGAAQAERSGIGGDVFDRMVAITGDPPGLMQLLEAFRRDIIDQATLEHGIRQSRVKDEWIGVVEALRTAPLDAAVAVAAAVQNQLDRPTAEHLGYLAGMSPESFAVAYNVHGRPPGPAEVIELVRRGVIPEAGTGPGTLSLEQAISESDVKDKWIPAYRALLEYRPPPRTVTALLRAGAITEDHALQLFRDSGLSTELAGVYAASATHEKAAPQHHLAQSTVAELYADRAITREAAAGLLGELGHTAEHAGYILDLVDVRRHMALVKAAAGKVGALYVARRIERQAAADDLAALKLPPDQVDALMTAWDLERQSNLRVLHEATIAAAWKYQALTDDEALAELRALGYTPFDAWIYLAAHNKGTGPGPKPDRDATHGVL